MPKAKYISISEVNELQTNIMKFIDEWVHTEKKPVPRKEIILALQKKGVNFPTIRFALYSLLRKGFIRESYTISNKTEYVQLRRV